MPDCSYRHSTGTQHCNYIIQTYVSFRLNTSCESHNYGAVASQLGLVSLAERRRISGIRFLNFLLQDYIPQRPSRSFAPFYVPFASTDYLKNEPIGRMKSISNDETFMSSKYLNNCLAIHLNIYVISCIITMCICVMYILSLKDLSRI